MKNVYKMILVAASTSVLFACGSSGSGSGVTGTISGGGSSSSVLTSVNSTFQGAKIFDGTAAGTATYDAANAKFIYNFNGTEIDVTSRGTSAGTVLDMTTGANKQMIGGTTYAYSRFGAIGPAADLEAADVFYVGQKTVNMPTSGTAVYNGLVIGMADSDGVGVAFDHLPVSFDVDFGAKTISGEIEGDSAIRFDQASITGNSFAGTLSDDGSGGTYSGSFFGPAAQELGGIGKSNPYIDANGDGAFSFGAKKQ